MKLPKNCLLLVVIFCLLSFNAQSFELIEIPVTIQRLWNYPLHLLRKDTDFVNAKRLERFGETVIIYKGPQTYQLNLNNTKTLLNNWNYSNGLDFAVSDWATGPYPSTFTRNNWLSQSANFNTAILDTCDSFDIGQATGNPFTNRLTQVEILHNTAEPLNVLFWDQTTRKMIASAEQISQCKFDLGFHSSQSAITAVTGEPSADVSAIAEDRSSTTGEFFVFDAISQDILLGSAEAGTYMLYLSKETLLALTGQTSVDLTGLTTDLQGNLYAWDRLSGNLLFYRAATGQLSKILGSNWIKGKTGASSVNIVDIDYLENVTNTMPANALALLDATSGSVLLFFRP